MNRNLSHWLAAIAIAASLSNAATAQTVTPSWTQSTQYRTTITPLHLNSSQSGELETIINTQSSEIGPVFIRERTELTPILTPEQLTIYDQLISPQYYYSYGLTTPEDWVNYRSRMVTRLNLTPAQQTRYIQVVSRTDSDLRPIVSRYETRYVTVLTPEQWVAYRSGTTSGFMQSSSSMTESRAASSSASVQSEEYRRVYRETTVQTSAPAAPAAAHAARPVKQTRAVNWRNQDLK